MSEFRIPSNINNNNNNNNNNKIYKLYKVKEAVSQYKYLL
jgi:hypothetical protein